MGKLLSAESRITVIRKRWLCIIWVLIFFFVYFSDQPAAQDSKGVEPIHEVTKNGRRVILYENSYALLVGVSEYEYWDDLKSIPGEMILLESSLKKHGFIIEKSLNPTCEVFKKTIDNFINRFGFEENNRLFIFFSGHGYTRKDGTKGYIVPSDAVEPLNVEEERKFAQKAIEMEQIVTWARRIESKHALFVFDSCFSGTIFQIKGSIPPPPEYVTYLTGKPVRQFITAGDAGDSVPAESKFLKCFIRGIKGEADAYNDGYITATELGLFVQSKIKEYGYNQRPLFGKLKDPDLDQGDFVFILDSKIKMSTNGISKSITKDNEKTGKIICASGSNIQKSEGFRIEIKSCNYDFENYDILISLSIKNIKDADANIIIDRTKIRVFDSSGRDYPNKYAQLGSLDSADMKDILSLSIPTNISISAILRFQGIPLKENRIKLLEISVNDKPVRFYEIQISK